MKLKLAVKKESERGDFSENTTPPPILDTQAVPFETLEGLFRVKLDNLDSEYVEGCLDWVSEERPELLCEAQEAERHVDLVWLDALSGKATLRDYEKAVAVWHKAYRACLEAYNQR